MAWEALNNIAADHTRRLVIVVNDNERSYSPTVGGLAHHLATLRTTRGYERFLEWGKQVLGRTPVVGPPLYDALHGVKKGLKDVVAPQGMFEDLGLKYIGPVDGHDVEAVEHALQRARGFGGPVLVHCLTRKGLGYKHAEDDTNDHFHGIGVIDPETGQPLAASGTSWTKVFSDEMVALGGERDDVVGHHRRDAHPGRPGRVRVGVPRPGPSTWASPSSTRRRRRRGWRSAGCTRWSRSTRRSSTGPSTRC